MPQPAALTRDAEPARRAARRIDVAMYCEVRQGMRPWARLRVDDLSAQGFRLHRLAEPVPYQPVRIRIPGLHILSACICWQRGKISGCAFTAPLHEAVLAHIVAALNGV